METLTLDVYHRKHHQIELVPKSNVAGVQVVGKAVKTCEPEDATSDLTRFSIVYNREKATNRVIESAKLDEQTDFLDTSFETIDSYIGQTPTSLTRYPQKLDLTEKVKVLLDERLGWILSDVTTLRLYDEFELKALLTVAKLESLERLEFRVVYDEVEGLPEGVKCVKVEDTVSVAITHCKDPFRARVHRPTSRLDTIEVPILSKRHGSEAPIATRSHTLVLTAGEREPGQTSQRGVVILWDEDEAEEIVYRERLSPELPDRYSLNFSFKVQEVDEQE
uniref:Uncharacterized protein n=1 Tax=viral metagenome TaxID=1070528 RepID=A0A6C0JXD5_9ZZZZ